MEATCSVPKGVSCTLEVINSNTGDVWWWIALCAAVVLVAFAIASVYITSELVKDRREKRYEEERKAYRQSQGH